MKHDNKLTNQEREHLKTWSSATAAQRLSWLEEMQKIALKSGAIKPFKSN